PGPDRRALLTPVEGVEPEHHGAAGVREDPGGDHQRHPRHWLGIEAPQGAHSVADPDGHEPLDEPGEAHRAALVSTIITEQGACWSTTWGMLPISHRRLPCRPRLPTTMTSAPSSSATEQIVVAGSPGTCRVATSRSSNLRPTSSR